MKKTYKLLSPLLFLFALGQAYGQAVPELLYYKFNGTGSNIPNLASAPPVGTTTALIVNGQAQGGIGQCGKALVGTGGSSNTDYVNTNWAPSLTGSWTLSFWTNNVPSTTTTYYILGDVNAGGFRVFTGGVAGAGNWILRGALTDTYAYGAAAAGPTLTTFVYDISTNEISSYVNGVLSQTVVQSAGVTVMGTGPFKVGGYATSNSLPAGSLMDEFRLYDRALSVTEIQELMITATSSTNTITACNSYTVPSGNQTYTTNGVYNDTILNVAGCDSLITVNLNIIHSTASTQTVTSCNSYTVPSGQSYTASGIYNDTIPNAVGCDSVITYNLSIINSSTSTITTATCNSYTSPGGNLYTTSGIYADTIPNAAGCDSIITINLTVNNSSVSTENIVACGSYTVPSGHFTYTLDGTYTDTIPNASGCDSIITINLTVNTVNVSVSASGIELTAGASGAAYQWIDCSTNMPVMGETNQSFTVAANGIYSVAVTENGCTDTSTCYAIVSLGMNANDFAAKLSLYPNPTQGQFTIACSDKQEKLHVEIVNALGELVQNETVSGADLNSFTINGSKGMYFVKITNTAGANVMIKVIKQ